MNAKVAIVTRTKNRPLLLERALRSVLGQTMHDFTLVIVNDSPDRGPVDALLAKYADEAGDRVVFVQNESSAGRWGAMDAGIDASDSEYFVLHDDDDSWHPEFLERTVAYLDGHPEDAAVGTRTELVYEAIAGNAVTELRRAPFATGFTEVSFLETLRQNYVPPIALLLRRSVFETIGRFNRSLPVLADWDFNLRLLSRFTVGFIDGEPLAYWHHRESSTGDDGNSVVADSQRHHMFNLLIRDSYLRQSVENETDLGPLLLTAELFRELDTKADSARAAHSAYIDSWRTANVDHIEAVNTGLSIEIGRLRGETIVLRETVAAMNETIESMRETLEATSKLVNELWSVDKGVVRLARERARTAAR